MKPILKITFFVWSIALLGSSLLAQNQSRIDSLSNVLESDDLTSEEQISALFWLSTYSSSPEDIIMYGNRLLRLAEDQGVDEYIVKANFKIGIGHRFMGNLDESLTYLFKSAKGAMGNDDLYPELAEIYAEISTCYTQNGDSQNALLYGSKSIGILRETGEKRELALSLLNLGYDYYLIGQYDSAMTYYNESEPILRDIGLDIGIAYIIGNRALVYWKKGDSERAKKDLFTAVEMLEPIGDTYAMADYYNQLGSILLEEENHDKVIEYAKLSYELSSKEEFKEQARDASYLLFLSYGKKGNYRQALEFQTNYHNYKDGIQNLETTQKMADLRTEFEVGRKQAEVDLLVEKRKNDRIIMIAGALILLAAIVIIFIINSYLRTKNRLNRQLEEQKNSLLLLNETKDKFFSIVSHDLRSPTNTLNGLIAVSKIYIEEGKNDRVHDMIDKMEHSMEGLIKLLDNLLNWALQQRGQFPYLPENVDTRKVIEGAVDTFEDMAASKKVTMVSELPETLKLYIDKNTASAIFRNLINNAIKFTPEGGEVKIQAEVDNASGFGVIKVSDTGVGIPADKVGKLFELNARVSTKGTSGEKGLGLGLQLVAEFVAMNKGKIEVDSKPDQGTTFTVFLPLNI
ncbi:MAG: tetratricopeptide repeat-containing sensor histidine kinase [Bacteroidota bacterium]